MENNYKYKVCTHCFTYNHSRYIEDALNGFVIQETTFPVVYCIVDDASTDNASGIIRDFFNMNFSVEDSEIAYQEETDYGTVLYAQHKTNKNCYFAVLFLKENHYSQKRKKTQYLNRWTEVSKYLALCEGDDYWIDSNKLQMQVDYLEDHNDCCMTACEAFWDIDGELTSRPPISDIPLDLETNRVILGKGSFLATCSLVYSRRLDMNIPNWRRIANVGDFPLQIQGSIEGTLHYFPNKMCVYRRNAVGNWSSRFRNDEEFRLRYRKNEVIWMKELDKATNKKYEKAIYQYLKKDIPLLYQKRLVPLYDYVHCIVLVGDKHDYKRMVKGIIKRLLHYHID